uniref:Uncharacterized protein n=1 Tax=Oryza punctata TaxID=4537 RepID=A0A0E0KF04_ORYPU
MDCASSNKPTQMVSAAAKEYQFMWILRLRAPLALFIKNREIYRPSMEEGQGHTR